MKPKQCWIQCLVDALLSSALLLLLLPLLSVLAGSANQDTHDQEMMQYCLPPFVFLPPICAVHRIEGVVLIANFGLRGSTFPDMIAKLAIPFATTVQAILKAELNVDCRMGATYDEAYCGVVGGVTRHEYAVLGPAVNLAARLMAHGDNKGFLVADSVRQKAGSREFIALPPVKAKGYKDLVPIFAPAVIEEADLIGTGRQTVNNKKAKELINSMTEEILNLNGSTKLMLIKSPVGSNVGVDLTESGLDVRDEVEGTCVDKKNVYLTLMHRCTEDDIIVPLRYVPVV